jgi:hypothetical protein
MAREDAINLMLSDLLDVLTSGNRAYIAMEAAIAQGYVEDPQRIRALYDQHREELEEFFQTVDIRAVLIDLRSSSGVQDTASTALTSAAAGGALTYFLTSILD